MNKYVSLIFIGSLALQICSVIFPQLSNTIPFFQLLNAITLSLIAASIFFFITVYFPMQKKKKIIKNLTLEIYLQVKKTLLGEFLLRLGIPRNSFRNRLDNAIRNYANARSIISDEGEEIENIRNRINRNYLVDTLYELNRLNHILYFSLSYDFIQKNGLLLPRIHWLSNSINQLHHQFNLNFRDDDNLEFSDWFESFIRDFLFGQHLASGQRGPIDDFIILIERS